MRIKIGSIIIFFFFALSVSGDASKKESAAETITEAELRDHVFFLASDALGGRVLDTPGYKIAAEYGVSQFKAAGLKTVYKDSNGKDSFLQEIPFVKISAEAESQLTVKTLDGAFHFPHENNLIWRRHNTFEVFSKSLPVVFIGYGIEEPEYGWNDFEELDIGGKIAIALVGAPIQDGKPLLPEKVHETYDGISGLTTKIRYLKARNPRPAALLFVENSDLTRIWKQLPSLLTHPYYQMEYEYTEVPSSDKLDVLLIKREMGEAFFKGHSYNPFGLEEIDLAAYKTFKLGGVEFILEVREKKERILSWNVVGMVEGTDPHLGNEYITVGAHLDHIPPQDGQVCNGADDNASGSAGILEIAEALAKNPSNRPVIFALWAGEESGTEIMGSRYFVKNPPVPLNQIKVNVNLDMIGRTYPKFAETRTHFVLGYESTLPAFKKIVDRVNAETVNWPLAYLSDEGSDHASFHNKGIPAFYFCSGVNEVTHTPNDDAEKIDYEKMEKIARLAYWVTSELANKGEFPKINKIS